MRVLYFTEADSPHDQRFLRALSGTQHQVYTLRQKDCEPNTPAGIIELSWSGSTPDWCCWDGWQTGKKKFLSLIDEIEPDLVHAGPVQGPAYITALSGFEPLVTMSWGSDILAKAHRSPWMTCTTQFVLSRTKIFLGDCQTVVNEVVDFGFPEDNIVKFPWGVDLDFFSKRNGESSGKKIRESLGWQNDFIILCNRNWHPIYGVDVLAKAFMDSTKEKENLRLLLVGDGPKASEIHNILAPAGEKVHYIGRVSPEKLPGIYAAADLFVSPSHCDGSSVSLLEAMACACPVLASDIPSNKEWVFPGKTGELFVDGDPRSLKDKLLQLSEDPDLAQLGFFARILAEERADWDKNFQKLLKAYQMAV